MTSRPISHRVTLVLTALLAACAHEGPPPPAFNPGLDTIYRAQVSFTTTEHVLKLANGTINPPEADALVTFLRLAGVSVTDRITLVAADPVHADDLRDQVNRVLGRFGLDIGDVYYVKGQSRDIARLVVSHGIVTLPSCGHFERTGAVNWRNEASPNYGCASRNNLAAMVANPGDLVSGVPHGLPDASLVAKPLENWEASEQSGIKDGRPWTSTGPATNDPVKIWQRKSGGGGTGAVGGSSSGN